MLVRLGPCFSFFWLVGLGLVGFGCVWGSCSSALSIFCCCLLLLVWCFFVVFAAGVGCVVLAWFAAVVVAVRFVSGLWWWGCQFPFVFCGVCCCVGLCVFGWLRN